MFNFRAAIVLITMVPATVFANTISQFVPDAQLVGSGRLTYLFWEVYDARLYAPGGAWRADKPYALELDYLLAISRNDIVATTIDEMKRLGVRDAALLGQWRERLLAIIPDVEPGTVITGIWDADATTYFFSKGEKLGEIKDRKFGPLFFDIWLASGTTYPALRRKLLNR